MPPKPKKTREQVLDTAVDLIRQHGLSALTARSLGSALAVAPSSVFTHFESMEALKQAVIERIQEIYEGYAERGLKMNPPFKGFGMEVLRFADEEPMLFTTFFFARRESETLACFIEKEGHLELIKHTIADTFSVPVGVAEEVYRNLWLYLCGLATLIATRSCGFSEEERSRLLGNACRSFLLSALAPKDENAALIPAEGAKLSGDPLNYLINAQFKEE